MPSGFQIGYFWSNLNDQGTSASTSIGTSVTCGTANTAGSYAQLVASTPYDSEGFILCLTAPSAGAGKCYAVTIGVGAGGSEQAIVTNLLCTVQSTVASVHYYIPLQIPSGSRIAAKAQCQTASATITASVILFEKSFAEQPALADCSTNGVTVSSATNGTSVDPGGSANTKGSYAQIVSSTSREIKALFLTFDAINAASSALQSWLIDIAVGAAASEQVIIPNIPVGSTAGDIILPPMSVMFNVNIPSGSRIAARAQGTNTTSGTRKIGVAVYGFG